MMELESTTVVVTGGGTGIGLGIAGQFAREGAQVIICGRRQEVLDQAIQEIQNLDHAGKKPVGLVCDVADRSNVEKVFSEIKSKFGEIHILVNCAGTNIPNRTMDKMDPQQWDQVMAINATGAYNCMIQVLPAMRERQDGLVINVSSIAGKRALTLGGIAYCASKFAMTALGTAVGNEVADEGVRITNVYPGEVNTPILENRPIPVSDEQKQKMVHPEDIGKLVVTIAALPPRAHVPEIIIKPTVQQYV